MGCDIHAMIEKKAKHYVWVNCGDPEIGRDYELFAVIGNVRNGNGAPFIAKDRGLPIDCTDEFESWHSEYGSDAHSCSWVTLKEMKEFDLNQEYEDARLVLARDENGNITECCGGTTMRHMGRIGKTKIFATFGSERWDALIKKMETFGGDEDVRLVFFFDN
jgi:hypothetical protein